MSHSPAEPSAFPYWNAKKKNLPTEIIGYSVRIVDSNRSLYHWCRIDVTSPAGNDGRYIAQDHWRSPIKSIRCTNRGISFLIPERNASYSTRCILVVYAVWVPRLAKASINSPSPGADPISDIKVPHVRTQASVSRSRRPQHQSTLIHRILSPESP